MAICKTCGIEKPDDQVKLGTCDHCFKFGPPAQNPANSPINNRFSGDEIITKCIACGREKPISALKQGFCVRCQLDGASQDQKYAAAIAAQEQTVPPKGPTVILTTSIDVPRREIVEVVGIVATEAAIGINIFRDIANSWRDFVGGRANSAQKSLAEVRQACLEELKREAARLGADAVIAVDLDYNELTSSAGSGGILFVAATGTAVTLAPLSAK